MSLCRNTLLALGLAVSCGEPGPDRSAPAPSSAATSADDDLRYSPSARPELHAELQRDARAPRHPADGGGTAVLIGDDSAARVGIPGRWTVRYEAGSLGIAEGGTLSLLVGPFWYWSPPQTQAPDAPGFTRVTSDARGIELETNANREKLYITLRGRELRPGEHVEIAYGAGSARAMPDRYAEREARFWIGVDGDGDGVEAVLAASPSVDVAPGPAAELLLFWPSAVEAGAEVALSAAVVDRGGNALWDFAGELHFDDPPAGVVLPSRVPLEPAARGRVRVPVTLESDGVFRLRGYALAGGSDMRLEGESNPLVAGERQSPILWADLHGHSQLSDGTGTPEDYFTYAREVAALDVVALTDHDHWGVRFLDRSPDVWERIQRATRDAHAPGTFVTLLGYEWTSWLYGHRHVLYFSDTGEVHSSIEDATDHPTELWDALRGQPALTFAHHSAGGPIATDWSIPPDPELEPLTEIVSVHGCSEAPDAPAQIYAGIRDNFVRDQLDRGYVFGFVGSGDGHDGHPGLARRNALSGGLAAILAEDRTRESVLAALRARRVYATNGERIVLRTSLSGHRMGSDVAATELADPAPLTVLIVGTAPLRYLDVVHRGDVVRLPLEGMPRFMGELPIPGLRAGDYIYVRVVQEDGGAAWSSPFYVR